MREEDGKMVRIELKIEKCTGCGTCMDQCPNKVFIIVDDKVRVVGLDACMACHFCETVCPQMGITVYE